VAVVVGASRGIGKGVAVELALSGAFVVAAGRTLDPVPGRAGSLAETVAAIADLGGQATAVRCDARDDDGLATLFARVRAEAGRLDVLVNAAFDTPGFRSSIDVPFWELPLSIWRDVVDVGTRAAYVACVHGVPLLLDSGGGLIVNISGRGAASYRYGVAYGVGKAALDRMTSDMAHELRDHGVAVVSVWPGLTRTEHMDAMLASGDAWANANVGHVASMETPRYLGRCIAALAADPDVLTRSGCRFWTAELAADYGVTDEFGRHHAVPEG
jgi:NAD(P)-dependent dehydrogenase (short-subunit alcohol dehydrogenase family)